MSDPAGFVLRQRGVPLLASPQMRDEVFGLASFLAVAEKRSFTAAAADLGVTPSALSQVVQKLEDRLGMRLLHRTTRSVGLTEAGERLFVRIKPAFGEMKLAVESLGELRDRPAGLLRITVSRTTSQLVFEPLLAAFLDQYPDIKVELRVDDGLADIVKDELDAGVRLGEKLDKEMIAVPITGPQRMAVVAAPSYLAKHPRPQHPRDLLKHDCIRLRQITSGALYAWEFEEQGREFEMALEGRVIFNDSGLVLRAAVDGLGVAYVLEDSARPHVQRGELVQLLRDFCAPFQGFFLYYPSRVQVPPKLRALIDFLRGRLSKPAAEKKSSKAITDRSASSRKPPPRRSRRR